MASAGILRNSNTLFPLLKGRQSTKGVYRNTHHWKNITMSVENNKMMKLNAVDKGGVMYFCPKNKIKISTTSTRSFKNDCMEVRGIQSPKQPQVAILPDKAA